MTTPHRTLRGLARQRPDLVIGIEGGATAPLVGHTFSQAGLLLGSLISNKSRNSSEAEAIDQAGAAWERVRRYIHAREQPGAAIGIGLSEGDTAFITLFAGEKDVLVVCVDFVIDAEVDLAFRNPRSETRIIVASSLLLHAAGRPPIPLRIAPEQVREGADITRDGSDGYILAPRRVKV